MMEKNITSDFVHASSAHRRMSRHRLINCLSRILSGIRAFEADLKADVTNPLLVEMHTRTYVNRLVDNVHEMNRLIDDMHLE
ncbi:MAG: hypothetical protein JXR76_12595 [Deltaproteobacteria bacterium]|nr:hypothetical protein [Deltaproteobacteria bacterium]